MSPTITVPCSSDAVVGANPPKARLVRIHASVPPGTVRAVAHLSPTIDTAYVPHYAVTEG